MIAALLIFGLMGAVAFRRLQSRGFPLLQAGGLIVLMLAQAAVCAADRSELRSALMALALYALAANAAALARERSLRSFVLMGGALTGAQALVPAGGFLTAAMLPALVGLPRSREELAKAAGLALILVFIPVLAMLVFAGLAGPAGGIASFVPAGPRAFSCAPAIFALALVLAPVTLATLFRGCVHVEAVMPLLVAVALAAALVGQSWFDVYVAPRGIMAAAAFVVPIAIGAWPKSPCRSRDALLVSAGGTALVWFVSAVIPT